MPRNTLLAVAMAAAFSSFIPVALAANAIEDFVGHAAYSTARISPDGKHMAITVEIGDQDVLTVLRMADMSIVKVNQLPDKKSVGQFYWAGPNRLVFNAVRKSGGYAAPAPTGEWFAVNADGSKPMPLIFYGNRDVTQRNKAAGFQSFRLVDPLDEDDQYILMEARSARSSEGSNAEIVKVDTYTGRRNSLGRAPKGGCSLALDEMRQPRFAVCSDTRDERGEYEERTELYRFDNGQWHLINASKAAGKHLMVIRTTRDGTVYAQENDGKAPGAIGILDTATGQFKKLFQDPTGEVSDLIWSNDRKTLLAVVTEAGAPSITLVDESHPDSELYSHLTQAFPGQTVKFGGATNNGAYVLFSVTSDRNPGELYLYDSAKKQARFLLKSRQKLNPAAMASVKPFKFQGRDGTLVHAFLTLPNGSDGKNLPLIVNPHGGPIGPRDYWSFNPEAQLLASRGYAVLQVNYRGSGGYGKGFQDAGHLQWASGIQHDIIDATKWVIEQGYADKNRICIYGGSFGGYSSLMAPIVAPGMFKCAFGYVGVYDIEMMHKRGDIPQNESGQRFLRRTHGTDKTLWARNSPAQRAAEVKIPVYLAAGARDVRTPPEQTELMASALTAAGNPPEAVIIQSGEMHGFYDVKNRVNLYTKMLEFFDRHIGKR